MEAVYQTDAAKKIRRLVDSVEGSVHTATVDIGDALYAGVDLAELAEIFDTDPVYTDDRTDAAMQLDSAIIALSDAIEEFDIARETFNVYFERYRD